MKLFREKVELEEFNKLEEMVWELENKLNSLCDLLGMAFGGHGGHTAKGVEKDKK